MAIHAGHSPVKLLEHWLPPDGAGDAVACFATTFTFDADFFTNDCLARFLRLSGAYKEGDATSDVALMLEEEERLSEARVVVLADRNCRPEARNLRWDLIPASVPSALLHAKVTLLLWQRAMRIIIGSANLTPAGYRRQLETAVAFDVDDESAIPRPFAEALIDELRDIVYSHTYGDVTRSGPKRRALAVLDLATERASHLSHLTSQSQRVRVALAPSKSGRNPLMARAQVWRGGPPRRVVALSPFWDDTERPTGAAAVLAELNKRSTRSAPSSATFVVAVEPLPGGHVVRAPRSLLSIAPKHVKSEIRSVLKEADDLRRLHAKVLLYEGDECIAAMIGSSNITAKGLGLDSRSHREINVWFAATPGTREADRLRALASYGDPVEATWTWDVALDEDELADEPLPLGFADALLVKTDAGWELDLSLQVDQLPASWAVSTPSGTLILDSGQWEADGRPPQYQCPIAEANPSALVVSWSAAAGLAQATWPVNVETLAALPPPAELRNLPLSVLLNVLASTRPLRVALETELRRQHRAHLKGEDELDPLKRFDSSGLLLHRVRHASAALWGLQQRLGRPLSGIEALDWRLKGTIGVQAIADGLIADVARGALRASEAGFLLGELALTVASVDWTAVSVRIDVTQVKRMVQSAVADIATKARSLNLESDASIEGLATYMRDAFKRSQSQVTTS
jgi:hypothetical protein